jgi:hypothetical protein
MRAQGVPYTTIATRLGKGLSNCSMHFMRMQEKAAAENWNPEMDSALKKAYQQKRTELWKSVANEMGNQTSWKVIEQRVFEIGKKGLHGASN